MAQINYSIFILKYFCRIVHMFSFAMLFGNVAYDIFIQPRPSLAIYSSLSITFYIFIILSGLVNMILFIVETKYIRDFHYEIWKKSLIVKFIITIFITPALEAILSLGVKDEAKISGIANPIKFTVMLIFILGSSYLRYYREYYMKKEPVSQ